MIFLYRPLFRNLDIFIIRRMLPRMRLKSFSQNQFMERLLQLVDPLCEVGGLNLYFEFSAIED